MIHRLLNKNKPSVVAPETKPSWNFRETLAVKHKASRRVSQEPPEIAVTYSSPKTYLVTPPVTYTTQKENSVKSKWLIRLARPFRIKWDLLVMVLAVWNCFYTPYYIVFRSTQDESPGAIALGTVIDLFFGFDIVLNFRTTFFSSVTGDEVFETKVIARNYLMGKFWIDLVSCVPSDSILLVIGYKESGEIGPSSIVLLFGLFKIYRIARLNRIINFMRAKNSVKLALRIGQLLFFLLMYVHLVACAWWIIVSYDQNWVPPADRSEIFDESENYQYWVAFYNSVLVLVGGDIGPRTRLQSCFASFTIIFGALITAVMFGNMAVLMSNLNMRQTKFQEKQNAANTAMKNMRLPEKLQQTISDHMIYTEATMSSREEFDLFKSLISPSLYREVLDELYQKIIIQNSLIGNASYIRDFIVPRLDPLFCKPEEDIITQGELNEQMKLYFVARGECEVSVTTEKKKEKTVGVLGPGSHFGEVALLTNGPRTASVRAKNYTTLGVLSNEDFSQLVINHKNTVEILKKGMFEYNDHYKKFLLRMIRRVPYLKHLNMKTEQEILYSLKEVYVEEGEYLLRPGVSCESFFFVVSGKIEVSFTLNDLDLHSRKETINDFSAHNLKKHTEVFPVWGSTGVEGSVHVTEVGVQDQQKDNYFTEIILDVLRIGSSLGFISAVSKEKVSIQAKTLKKCKLLVLEKSTINKLRMNCMELHRNLLSIENWCKEFTPHLDDYICCNDKKCSLGFKSNLHRLRGAVLRVIKESRDKKVLETPIIALLTEKFSQKPGRKSQHLSGLTKWMLKVIFDPKNRAKLKKFHNKDKLSQGISQIAETLLSHSNQIAQISTMLEEYLCEAENGQKIQTVPFKPVYKS